MREREKNNYMKETWRERYIVIGTEIMLPDLFFVQLQSQQEYPVCPVHRFYQLGFHVPIVVRLVQ